MGVCLATPCPFLCSLMNRGGVGGRVGDSSGQLSDLKSWWLLSLLSLPCSILKIVELIGFKMDYSKEIKSIVFPGLALAVLRPDPMNFQGVLFGVTSYQSYVDPEVRDTFTVSC